LGIPLAGETKTVLDNTHEETLAPAVEVVPVVQAVQLVAPANELVPAEQVEQEPAPVAE
jgi:hypothetical protein